MRGADANPSLTGNPKIYIPKRWQLTVPGAFSQVRWFGRGPHECYPDRKSGCPICLYSSSVDDTYVPYRELFLFFFITLKPRVDRYKSL